MPGLRLFNVAKSYGDVPAVRDVSLNVYDGEFLVLLGPSGCGKSTLLRLIAGLETPDAGEIWLGNRLLNDLPPRQRGIAMVFQSYALYPHLRVEQNLAFGLELSGLRPSAIRERVAAVARDLRIAHLLKRRPAALSGGERQRTALGRALVREPDLFLLDEPLSNLDAKLRLEAAAEIRRLHLAHRTTTIYVTHDQREALALGSRVAVLNEGRLLQLDDPQTLYERPADLFVAGFIGSPPMNLLTVRVVPPEDGTEGPLWLRGAGVALAVPPAWRPALRRYLGRAVVLGVRPEALRIVGRTDGAPVPQARVQRLERLGHATFAFTEVGGAEVAVRLGAGQLPRPGETVALTVAGEALHFFDPERHYALD